MDVNLVFLCSNDTWTCVCAVGFLVLPAVLPLQSLAEDPLVASLFWLWRTGPDCYNLNGGVVVVGCHRA